MTNCHFVLRTKACAKAKQCYKALDTSTNELELASTRKQAKQADKTMDKNEYDLRTTDKDFISISPSTGKNISS